MILSWQMLLSFEKFLTTGRREKLNNGRKKKKISRCLNILSFNRHFYFIGLGILALLLTSPLFFEWPTGIFWIVIGAFLYGLLMPLMVSAYVYDFSGYYEFDWLKKQIQDNISANQIVNINAGFDETSFILKNRFPNSDLKVFDFYNADQHT